jgi:hypothetical protein
LEIIGNRLFPLLFFVAFLIIFFKLGMGQSISKFGEQQQPHQMPTVKQEMKM